jgi:hypothetical protein
MRNPTNLDDPDDKAGWFNPLQKEYVLRNSVTQQLLDRKLQLFPPGSCQPLPAPTPTPTPSPGQPRTKEPNDSPHFVLQGVEQSTRHWRFPNSKSYGPIIEHAVGVQAGGNFPIHPEGKRGFEFGVAVTFLYDLYYLNDKNQSQEAYLDHSVKHRPKNLQLTAQVSYLWPFFLKEGKDSILDVSVLGQISPAINWQYDYDAHQMSPGPQLQIVLGVNVTVKPFAHLKDGGVGKTILKNFFITGGPMGGATFGSPNTGDVVWTFGIGTQFP